jgi:hypothetical protein
LHGLCESRRTLMVTRVKAHFHVAAVCSGFRRFGNGLVTTASPQGLVPRGTSLRNPRNVEGSMSTSCSGRDGVANFCILAV